MKVYISADMEGVTGVSHWEEVDHNKSAYSQFQKQMSLEVAAACEGAIAAGAKEILVKLRQKYFTILLTNKGKDNTWLEWSSILYAAGNK